MQKRLPPATVQALSPPANAAFPYTFFADGAKFQAGDHSFNLGNASWLADAAFLAYSSEDVIREKWQRVVPTIEVKFFPGESTQCYVAASSDWIILAWRGTQVDDFWASVLDWLNNVQFLPVPDADHHLVYSGFLKAIDEVWGKVRSHVAGLQEAAKRPLWMTGHSLGAALATIAANRCSHRDDLVLGHEGTYTYGSPRVGDPAFGERIGKPVFRFQNNTDFVTHFPIGLIYKHVGEPEFIDAGGHLHGDFAMADHLFPVNALVVEQLTHLLGGRLGTLLAVPGPIADHAPINYATLIWNAFDRSR